MRKFSKNSNSYHFNVTDKMNVMQVLEAKRGVFQLIKFNKKTFSAVDRSTQNEDLRLG